MKARIEWAGNAKFVGESGSGHQIIMDGPPEIGGNNEGVRPMEMVLLGMGGCSSIDVVHILKKQRLHVSGCIAELSAERADSEPKVFTKIHMHFIVSGEKLNHSKVSKAVELSAEKYCSAAVMLARGGVEVTHDYEIIEEAK
jgi:putative redox protein